MKISIQVEDIEALKEAQKSDCDKIRFGSEFCEWKVLDQESLEKAYTLTKASGKIFSFVTPRVSNIVLEKIEKQLSFLDSEEALDVVVNDFGVLNLLERFQSLRPCLGRQLVYIPARSPWKQITRTQSSPLLKRRVEEIFYQTALNYQLTSTFFQKMGVKNIDVDWIPRCFPYFNSLIERGFNLSVHLYLIPITITRKCHTARFLDEEKLEDCTKPCYMNPLLLKQKVLGVQFYLCGNVVFRLEEPSGRSFRRLSKKNEVEFVATMSPITKLNSKERINDLVSHLKSKVFKLWL